MERVMTVGQALGSGSGMVLDSIAKGSIIAYPTDTVYGIGCNAEIGKAVERLRGMKKTSHPFSVIAPSVGWVKANFVITKAAESWLKRLPGKYTLILGKRDGDYLKEASSGSTLGIRIPNHRFTRLVQKSGIPFVSTSANISGKPVARSVDEIGIRNLDMIIDGGRLGGKASLIVDCTSDTRRFIERR